MHIPKLLKRLYQNPIRVHDLMHHVLYDESEGYYAKKVVTGKTGDYITSPYMTQAFGDVLAAWFIYEWQRKGQKKPIHLIELGPGNGLLMADMVRIFQKFPEFVKALQIHLVECSGHFMDEQKKHIHHPHVYWHKTAHDVPPTMDGICFFLAHEFFDALPIEQFVWVHDKWQPRMVQLNSQNELEFTPEGDKIQEKCPLYKPIIESIQEKLDLTKGSGLIIDYGDFTPHDRFGDTLQAIYQHKKVGVFEHLGAADLTHQVDFFTLQNFLKPSVRRTFMTQSEFLKSIGFLERTQYLCEKVTPEEATALKLAAARLLAPQEMGSLFKALILDC